MMTDEELLDEIARIARHQSAIRRYGKHTQAMKRLEAEREAVIAQLVEIENRKRDARN